MYRIVGILKIMIWALVNVACCCWWWCIFFLLSHEFILVVVDIDAFAICTICDIGIGG